ncbi:hypothetical protein BVRB_8g186080 [Beta vulgaris subsp. vulgaris]|nr:hypothetical protein BVRB_8g186080 [Beta vulgaris subsp. vulgaris]
MPSFSSFFSWFPSSKHQVACEEASQTKTEESKGNSEIKRSSAPIVVSKFPVGARLSLL